MTKSDTGAAGHDGTGGVRLGVIEDYVGFHTMMALAPAFHMARELPEDRRALPVLKVLYRNTNRIHEHGGRASEVLRTVRPGELSAGHDSGEALRDAEPIERGGHVRRRVEQRPVEIEQHAAQPAAVPHASAIVIGRRKWAR